MPCVGQRIASAAAAVQVAQTLFLATGDAVWAYNYLDERRQTLRLADPEVTETLLELADSGARGLATEELREETARRIGNLI